MQAKLKALVRLNGAWETWKEGQPVFLRKELYIEISNSSWGKIWLKCVASLTRFLPGGNSPRLTSYGMSVLFSLLGPNML